MILEGKIINMKVVFVICVYVCVCVWDFGSKNDKSEICAFVICVSDFGTGMTGRRPRGPTGRVWGEKNNLFIKRAGFGSWRQTRRSGLGIEKPAPNPTCCHSYK